MSDVFGDEMFVRYCKCICGVGIVYDNTLMQWYIVIQRVAECGEVKSFTRMGNGQARYDGGALGGVFGDEVFVRYCECIGGAVTVCDNAAMQWCIVVQRVAECGGVKSGA